MLLITLKNDSSKDIMNYPIAEALFDSDGKIIMDSGNGQPTTTGKTLVWTIHAGETLSFPDYVANYLMGIYDFLVPATNVVVEENQIITEGNKEFICKYCGKNFETLTKLGRHKGLAHAEKVGSE